MQLRNYRQITDLGETLTRKRKGESWYTRSVALCRVTDQDIEHSVNAQVDSVYEAAAKVVQIFRNKPAPIKKPG
jgi:hypothetical protein